jgi:hypothetical protein
VGRVDQKYGKGIFEQIVDGLPILTRAFHGDMGNARFGQPVGQDQQVAGHGPKRSEFHDPLGLSARRIRDHPTGSDTLLMNIQARAPRKHHIHRAPPCTPGTGGIP